MPQYIPTTSSLVQNFCVRSLAQSYQFVRQHSMGGYKMHHDHDCGGNHEEKDGVGWKYVMKMMVWAPICYDFVSRAILKRNCYIDFDPDLEKSIK